MIKKYKNINILLPPLRITLDDIYATIDTIKKNNLGSVKIYDEKDNIVYINKINKDRLKNLKFLCANKLKQLGKAEEVKALISSVIYDECFCL